MARIEAELSCKANFTLIIIEYRLIEDIHDSYLNHIGDNKFPKNLLTLTTSDKLSYLESFYAESITT